MDKLRFALPDNKSSCKKFTAYLSLFEAEKLEVLKAISAGDTINRNKYLERSVYEDIVSVLIGIKKVPSGSCEDWTMWSLHRDTPQWGAPLFGLTANEAEDAIYLSMHLLEKFEENDERGTFIWFKSIIPYTAFENVFDELLLSKGINYWLKLEGEFLDVYFEIITG